MAGRALMLNGRAIMRAGRALMGTSGAPCCCGPVPCGCLTPCGPRNGFITANGRYIQIDNSCGGPQFQITTDNQVPGACCCRNAPGRIYARHERYCHNGFACDGALRYREENWYQTDGVTATWRRKYVDNSVDCCSGPVSTFDQTVPFEPNWCLASSFFGSGLPHEFAPGAGFWNWGGTWKTTCTSIETDHLSATWCPGSLSPGYNFISYVRGYFSLDECHTVPCLHACCLPGGRCRDDLTPPQCEAIGGVPFPGQDCYNAGCDLGGPNKGACCNPATGGCILTPPAGCVAPNTFQGLGSTCETLARPGCPQPTGRCCIPDGAGGYNCIGATTQQVCSQTPGSIWGGYLSTCVSHPCPSPAGGACCVDGNCIQVGSPQACLNQGGVFLGSNTDCQILACKGGSGGGCCFPTGPGGTNWTCSEGYDTCQCLNANGNMGIWRGCGSNCVPPPWPQNCTPGGSGNSIIVPFRPPLVLPDGTPITSIGTVRTGGCSSCNEPGAI